MLSRRQLIKNLFRPLTPQAGLETPQETIADPPPTQRRIAIIKGRECLAYRHLSCTICSERCPEANAIITTRGIPQINPTACTGCGICHDVCPAPTNAILLIPQ